MQSKSSRDGYLNCVVMNMQDQFLCPKSSSDISFVEKEHSSGSPTLMFLMHVVCVCVVCPWLGGGLV